MYERQTERERERERVVCVCVRERETDRQRESGCVWAGVRVCVREYNLALRQRVIILKTTYVKAM